MPVGAVAAASMAVPKIAISVAPWAVTVTEGDVERVAALVVIWPPWTSTGVVGLTPR